MTKAKVTLETADGGREKRTTQIARGMKNGIIKGTIDKLVERVAEPATEKILPMLHNLHPGLQTADPAVRSFVDFAIISALAEVFEYAGPALSKVPGVNMDKDEATLKTRALAMWMRNYAAEKLGTQVVETAGAFVPLIIDMMKDMDLSDIMGAISNQKNVQVEVDAPAMALGGR